jgi:acyl-coenzyme A thioesterase PaaI-like protein
VASDGTDATAVALADAVRRLLAATILTAADEAAQRDATAAIEAAAAQLEQQQRAALPGLDPEAMSKGHRPYSPVIGLANPIAPPMTVDIVGDGEVEAHVTLGPLHEGPPGVVHGGWVATLLDQLLGHAIAAAGVVGFTSELTVRYRRPTPHSVPLTLLGHFRGVEGRVIEAAGEIYANGEVTAEATARFKQPSDAKRAEMLASLAARTEQ